MVEKLMKIEVDGHLHNVSLSSRTILWLEYKMYRISARPQVFSCGSKWKLRLKSLRVIFLIYCKGYILHSYQNKYFQNTLSLSTMLILLSTLFLPMFGNINWKKYIYLLCVFYLPPEKFLDFRRNIIYNFYLHTDLKNSFNWWCRFI